MTEPELPASHMRESFCYEKMFGYLMLRSIFSFGIWLLRIRLSGNMASWTKSAA